VRWRFGECTGSGGHAQYVATRKFFSISRRNDQEVYGAKMIRREQTTEKPKSISGFGFGAGSLQYRKLLCEKSHGGFSKFAVVTSFSD
jgi:hypothetical protein